MNFPFEFKGLWLVRWVTLMPTTSIRKKLKSSATIAIFLASSKVNWFFHFVTTFHMVYMWFSEMPLNYFKTSKDLLNFIERKWSPPQSLQSVLMDFLHLFQSFFINALNFIRLHILDVERIPTSFFLIIYKCEQVPPPSRQNMLEQST